MSEQSTEPTHDDLVMHLTLRALPDKTPAAVRFRLLLKVALRWLRLKSERNWLERVETDEQR